MNLEDLDRATEEWRDRQLDEYLEDRYEHEDEGYEEETGEDLSIYEDKVSQKT